MRVLNIKIMITIMIITMIIIIYSQCSAGNQFLVQVK